MVIALRVLDRRIEDVKKKREEFKENLVHLAGQTTQIVKKVKDVDRKYDQAKALNEQLRDKLDEAVDEGSKGEVIAEAELAWPDHQLAIAIEPDDVETFTNAGWRCWLIDDSPDTPAAAPGRRRGSARRRAKT